MKQVTRFKFKIGQRIQGTKPNEHKEGRIFAQVTEKREHRLTRLGYKVFWFGSCEITHVYADVIEEFYEAVKS